MAPNFEGFSQYSVDPFALDPMMKQCLVAAKPFTLRQGSNRRKEEEVSRSHCLLGEYTPTLENLPLVSTS